jgi:hypothetical protein
MQVLYHGTISSGNVFATGQEFGETSISFADPTYIYIIQILGEGDSIALKPNGNSKSLKNQLVHSETRNIFTPIEVFGSDSKSSTYQYLQWICPMTRPMTVVDRSADMSDKPNEISCDVMKNEISCDVNLSLNVMNSAKNGQK